MNETENDMDKLRAAFISAHVTPEQPDLMLRLGSYSWKVHSLLFIESSRYFKAALTGDFEEKKKNEIVLTEDDPYIVARAIEFAYLGKYSVKTGGLPHGGMQGDKRDALAQGPSKFVLATMEPFTSSDPDDINLDQGLDEARTSNEVHCEVIKLADKYDWPTLLNAASNLLPDSPDTTDFWRLHGWVGHLIISRHEQLQEKFARMAARLFAVLNQSQLQQWVFDDPRVGYEIAKALEETRAKNLCAGCARPRGGGW